MIGALFSKNAFYGAIAIIVVIALARWTMWHREDAAQDVIQKIEEINNEMSSKAISAREARSRCVAAGGMWDFGSSKCKSNN